LHENRVASCRILRQENCKKQLSPFMTGGILCRYRSFVSAPW
jgi:hypothetical protein